MCSYADLRDEIQLLRQDVEMLSTRMTAVEEQVQASVLTTNDLRQAINESDVLTRAEFEAQLFDTIGDVGARVRTWTKRAVYSVAGFLAVIAGIILAIERIWGVFS